ncbi:MAG: ABC transporter substrate-binding protein [Arcobacteraceae bacterium]
MKKLSWILVATVVLAIQINARTITDMANRTVTIDEKISKVATVGSIPVINSFIFAVGKGDTIVSGLNFAKKSTWKYQQIFQPSLINNVEIQGVAREILIEPMINLAPQIVFTMDFATVELLEKNNIPVVFLKWKNAEDIREVISLMGEIYNEKDVALNYIEYFKNSMDKIEKNLTVEVKPKVLFANLGTLDTPHLIAEWWIDKAGGISVTNNGRTNEKFTFSHEQVIAWNPDILIVETPKDLKIAYEDSRFSTINAVKNRQVFVAPVAAHKWSNRTSELPLMVLWAANIFHKNIQNAFPIEKEMKYFYDTFYKYKINESEIKEILGNNHE